MYAESHKVREPMTIMWDKESQSGQVNCKLNFSTKLFLKKHHFQHLKLQLRDFETALLKCVRNVGRSFKLWNTSAGYFTNGANTINGVKVWLIRLGVEPRLHCAQSCLFASPWTVACQAALSVEFSRQEYWGGLPFLLQRIFITQGSKPVPPALAVVGRFLTTEPPGKPK